MSEGLYYCMILYGIYGMDSSKQGKELQLSCFIVLLLRGRPRRFDELPVAGLPFMTLIYHRKGQTLAALFLVGYENLTQQVVARNFCECQIGREHVISCI